MFFRKSSKFRHAIVTGDLATVKKMTDEGMDVTASGYGPSPVLLAVYHGHKDIVEFMIQKGAKAAEFYRDEEMTRDAWSRLMHVAAAQGHKHIVQLLLDSDRFDKALVDQRDNEKNTALHVAAAYGRKEIVELLLAAGFDENLKGANEKLPVGFAFQSRHEDIVKIFTDRKVAAEEARLAAKAAQPKPAPAAEPMAEREFRWKLTDTHSVTQVTQMRDVGYRITEIFNFAARERIRIVNNLKTGADNVETTPFANLSDKGQLEEAFAALKRLGGTADEAVLGGVKKPRLTPPA